MACTNMHSPEAALETLVTTSICMLGFSTYGLIFFRIAGLMLSCGTNYTKNKPSQQREPALFVLWVTVVNCLVGVFVYSLGSMRLSPRVTNSRVHCLTINAAPQYVVRAEVRHCSWERWEWWLCVRNHSFVLSCFASCLSFFREGCLWVMNVEATAVQ